MTLKKSLFNIFHLTTLSFFCITFIAIPSTSEMVSNVTYILFTTSRTVQQVNQKFIVAIKTMAFVVRIFSGEANKFVSNMYTLTNLTPRTITPLAPYLSFNRIELWSHYVFFCFSRTSVRYYQRRWENLWTSPSLNIKGSKSLIKFPSSLTFWQVVTKRIPHFKVS